MVMFRVYIVLVFVFITRSKELINGELRPCDFVREELIHPYREVQDSLSLNPHGINKLGLNEIIDHLFERFQCVGGYVTECNNTQCLDADDVYNSLQINSTGILSEAEFGKASTILLAQLLNFPLNCSRTIILDKDYKTYKDNLLSRVFKGPEIESGPLQEFLEQLNTYIKKDSDHHDDHDHSQTEKMGDHGDNDHGHEEMPDTIEAKCASGKTIFEQAGYNPSMHLEGDSVDHISSVVLYHILSGSKVEEDCRLLPRRSDFVHTLMEGLHAVNDSLSHTDFEELLSKLKLKNHTTEAGHQEESTDDGHNHRRKRDTGHVNLRRVSRDTTDHHSNDQHSSPSVAMKCFTADEILAIHNVKHDGRITESKLQEISPTLISLQLAGVCEINAPKTVQNTTVKALREAERYGYSSLAVFIICLCSLTGALFIPLASKETFKVIISVFMGIAVGTLTGDALLHLLPEAFGLHLHSADEHGHDSGSIEVEKFVLYALAALAATCTMDKEDTIATSTMDKEDTITQKSEIRRIYAFYLLEVIMSVVRGKRGMSSHHGHSHIDLELDVVNKSKKEKNGNVYVVSMNGKDEHAKDTNRESEKQTNTSLALMVIIGDGIHNFADGIAVGAAFSLSNLTGLSTSITIFCHELPHELGDFAILLASGFGFKKALMANFISSLTAFVGLYVGLLVSTDNAVRQWIFAITAGNFLYIALVDMLPELIHGGGSKHRIRYIFCNNVGMFLGLGIMVCLSIFEEKIVIS